MQAYFLRFNLALESGSGKQFIEGLGFIRNSIEGLLGQGKLLLGNSGLPFSLPFSTLVDAHLFARASTVFALRLDPHIVNRRRNISVVGALSRTISIPSVSGPSIQVCEYHIDRLVSNSTSFCSDILPLKNSRFSNSVDQAGSSYRSKSIDNCRQASRSWRNQEPSNSNLTCGDFFFDFTRRSCNSNLFQGSPSRDFHCSSSTCYSAGTASGVSLDVSACQDQIVCSSYSSDEKILGDRTLKLLSGSCYLPHPDREETGGEDAHFICEDEQAIGVADGVGGWAASGIDAGLYARELMSNSVNAIQEEPKGSIDPVRVLEKAHSNTKAEGSSTACIVALTEQGLNAINLGDSVFVVIRNGDTVFRSPVQQHYFNFTYQLKSGNGGDLPSSGQVFTIPVAPGDVIVAGTDGLFDNLYNNEVTSVVVHAVRAGLGPKVMAQKIAALARQRAQDQNRQTPFSTAAQDAGFCYYGGKLDDITVVVSCITTMNL